jgi:hypothetical protein
MVSGEVRVVRRMILPDSLISGPRYRMLLVVVRLVVVAGDLKGELAMVERRLASEWESGGADGSILTLCGIGINTSNAQEWGTLTANMPIGISCTYFT